MSWTQPRFQWPNKWWSPPLLLRQTAAVKFWKHLLWTSSSLCAQGHTAFQDIGLQVKYCFTLLFFIACFVGLYGAKGPWNVLEIWSVGQTSKETRNCERAKALSVKACSINMQQRRKALFMISASVRLAIIMRGRIFKTVKNTRILGESVTNDARLWFMRLHQSCHDRRRRCNVHRVILQLTVRSGVLKYEISRSSQVQVLWSSGKVGGMPNINLETTPTVFS